MNAPASRRGFLKALSVMSAGAAVTIPLAVQAATPVPDRELLDLGRQLAEAVAALERQVEAVEWARSTFEDIKPEIPEGLILKRFDGWVAGEWPPSFEGHCSPGHVSNRIRIPCRYALDQMAKRLDGRTVLGRRARKTRQLSDAYHAAHEAARVEAGGPKELTARHWKVRAVIDLGFAIMAIDAQTMAGLTIKARAGLAMHRAWAHDDMSRGGPESSYASLCANIIALDPTGVRQCA
nr:twin-arginine translocation signal domain-containing protein [Methylobacterium sp. OTU13CASTA1]